MSTYNGDSLAKKVARIRLYTRTREALLFMGIKLNSLKALFLIGPHASEVGALKHMLEVKPENAVGVDLDAQACAALEEKWPGAHVVHGKLETTAALRRCHSAIEGRQFDFIHLDLMGNLTYKTEILYGNWSRLCGENGVVAVTYLRAREKPSPDETTNDIRDISKGFSNALRGSSGDAKKLLKLLGPDPQRAASHLSALNFYSRVASIVDEYGDADAAIKAMKEDKDDVFLSSFDYSPLRFTPIASYAYQGDSPMGVLACHRVTHETLESESYANLRYQRSRHSSCTIGRDPMTELLKEAELLEMKYGKAEALEILDLTRQQLAAYRAHRTMGTYK